MLHLITLVAFITNPYAGWNEHFILHRDTKLHGIYVDGAGKWTDWDTGNVEMNKLDFVNRLRNRQCMKFYSDADPATHSVIYYCDIITENGRNPYLFQDLRNA